MGAGSWEEAEAAAKENPRRLPEASWAAWELSGTYCFQRKYDEALELVRWMAAHNTNNLWAYIWKWKVHAVRGEIQEALEAVARIKAIDASPAEIAAQGYLYGRMGRVEDARQTLVELERLSTQRFVSKDCWALVYAGLEDRNKAIEYIEKAADEPNDSVVHLNVDPLWDWLRDDPAFISLVQRLELGK
jgi:tetratricopeptide (TPR) repeat protein